MKPTTERMQHALAVEPPRVDKHEFRQGWRIRTRLDVLHATGRITAAEYQAACDYRAAWERVLSAVTPAPGTARVSANLGINGNTTANAFAASADTLTRIRLAESAIGSTAALLCHRCCVEDWPWTRTAKLLHRDRETVREWTICAIQGLARIWGLD